jgi:hypothetical protein
MPKSKAHSYNLMLSADDDEKLHALQVHMRATGATVLRNALDALYRHRICESPSCADGHPCFVPQMHTPLYQGRRNNASRPPDGTQ